MEKHFNDLFENVKNKINVMKNQIARDENPARRLYAQKRCAEEINQICKEILEALDAHSRAYLEPLNEIKKVSDKISSSDD
ncbi:hypothetical protein [uncultured Fibrobacter sp.]|uniref:hypothetical protein n=1 Tax=uncultured Fibrobacter sp. TaxID=261512 RepID=UPI0028059458|nr:hypothetical protein [uncultured Fibrobacter sp.]